MLKVYKPKNKRDRRTWLSIELPSNGINYEEFGDREIENHVDYHAGSQQEKGYHKGEMDFEHNWPEVLQLDVQTVSSIMFDVTDWSKIRAAMHEEHTEAVESCLNDETSLNIDLKHDDGDTALIPLMDAKKLFKHCKKADNFANFKELFEDNDHSWPRRKPEDVLAEPLRDWGQYELGWLLQSARNVGYEKQMPMPEIERQMRLINGDPTTYWDSLNTESEFDSNVYQFMCENESEYTAWSDAVDWEAYEKKVREARQDKFDDLDLSRGAQEEFTAEEIELLHDEGFLGWDGKKYRCPFTIDMFTPAEEMRLAA